MKKPVRRLSILLVLCLLLTMFAGAKTVTKIHVIEDIDAAVTVPASVAVLDSETMEAYFNEDFYDLVDILVTNILGDEVNMRMSVHMMMEDPGQEIDDYFMGFVLSVENMGVDTVVDFRSLSDEEFDALNEIYSMVFDLFSSEELAVSAAMVCTPHENFVKVKMEHTDGTERDIVEYFVTYHGEKAYVLAFATNMEDRFEMTDVIANSVVFDRTAIYPGGFMDLKGHWAADDVVKAVDLGLFKGNTVLEFAPDAGMTRAMLVQVLHRMEGEPEAGESKFSDVAADAWYADAVAWASENGIVKGSGGKFDPDGLLTREQLAAILWRYAQYEGRDVSVGEDTNILSYNDAFDISEYAYAPLQWACGDGLIKGASGNLMPQGTTTRAQVATILVRYLAE